MKNILAALSLAIIATACRDPDLLPWREANRLDLVTTTKVSDDTMIVHLHNPTSYHITGLTFEPAYTDGAAHVIRCTDVPLAADIAPGGEQSFHIPLRGYQHWRRCDHDSSKGPTLLEEIGNLPRELNRNAQLWEITETQEWSFAIPTVRGRR